jgi:hypothetical protein
VVDIINSVGNPELCIKFGDSSVVATASDIPILPGSEKTYMLDDAWTHVSVYGASGSLRFVPGCGQ